MESLSPFRLHMAARCVAGGGVLAYPTEAVWGLGCDPWNEPAVDKILVLKGRPREKGLILVAADIAQLSWVLSGLSPGERDTLEQSWPGAVTWLVPHRDRVPPWISGRFSTVGVRVSAHPVVRSLCQAVGGALVSTSANPAGGDEARSMFRVRRYFGQAIDYMLPGRVDMEASPSSIRDLATDTIIRAA
jgi:L-threonylcarbamoyladenylate synthase